VSVGARRANGSRIIRGVGTMLVACVMTACSANPRVGRVSSRPTPTDSVGCLDTLHAGDSVTTVVKLVVVPRDSGAVLPADFENLFAEEFRARFKVPAKMALSLVRGVPPCDSAGSRCARGMLDFAASAYATAQSNGKLSDIAVLDIALTPALSDSVASALKAMSRDALGPPTGGVDSIPVIVRLEREDSPDSVPPYRQILKVTLPRYELPFSYAMMPASGVDAKYPFTARLAGVGDSVIVAYTVQSDGSILPESLELVKANYRDFVRAVADALLATRYHPARLGDCAVATRMEQRFLFKVPD
jgi:hypothetical protein